MMKLLLIAIVLQVVNGSDAVSVGPVMMSTMSNPGGSGNGGVVTVGPVMMSTMKQGGRNINGQNDAVTVGPVMMSTQSNEGSPSKIPTCLTVHRMEEKTIISPGFPYRTRGPCDFKFSAALGKRVEAQIVWLDANACCDTLTLLDGSGPKDNVVATLTGRLQNATVQLWKTNVMGVQWRPNAGVNVQGVMVTFREVE
ncbi:hypothetical protein PRIPAC_85224 [Pristionchus pacificus]|uniref:Uncharacterized protein n=1 Tax=Pristionchus pacificus TaxID=54126 RepID=A0A2A6BSK7_PRIPA|nr:hypothetical protein PRIPAC_85224 [Pristionchus pacificus]|eukprot:PDM68894.1 hypothetical protein PRIPAC_47196 [Pristionchus pacificus]